MGKDIDSAMVRRNEKFCGYGRKKKEDERIGVCIYGKQVVKRVYS